MTLEAAPLDALPALEALLAAARLPIEGLRDQFPDAYVIATYDAQLVGCAALERYGSVGLLRSVAVLPEHQRRGIGAQLVANRIAAARDRGLGAVYLLTTTAAEYFRRIGFAPADRGAVSPELAACPEFASACPASAACLRLTL